VHPIVDAVVGPELRGGWLAFESREEKRRLAPVPAGWETASDDELREFLTRAAPRGKPRRLAE
jgi:hypothetical protein